MWQNQSSSDQGSVLPALAWDCFFYLIYMCVLACITNTRLPYRCANSQDDHKVCVPLQSLTAFPRALPHPAAAHSLCSPLSQCCQFCDVNAPLQNPHSATVWAQQSLSWPIKMRWDILVSRGGEKKLEKLTPKFCPPKKPPRVFMDFKWSS